MIRRTRIKRQGKRGAQGQADRDAARLLYFTKYATRGQGPEDWEAPCQACGRPMRWDEADAAHKTKRSLKAGNEQERLLIVHGHRTGFRNCHNWLDEPGTPERQQLLKDTPINAETGGILEWSPQLNQDLIEWTARTPYSWRPILSGSRSSALQV